MVVITSFPPPTEGIKHEQPCTRVFMNSRELGKGTMFIAESCLCWVNNETNTGFSLQYQHLALHAVSRDLQAHPHECLYVMVDTCLEENNDNADDANEDDDDEENSSSGMTEMHFVPDDKGALDAMYIAMNECQALHPDPADDSLSEDDHYEDADSEGEYVIGNANNIFENAYNQERHNGSRNAEDEEAMDVEDGQFEDADADSLPEN